MRIPRYCGSKEFAPINRCAEKVEVVLDTFSHGGFIEKDLDELTSAARRVAYVCEELIKWQNVKRQVGAAAINDKLDSFSWE